MVAVEKSEFDDFYPFAFGYVKRRIGRDLFQREREDIKQIVAVAVLECILNRNHEADSGQFATYCGLRAYGAIYQSYFKRKQLPVVTGEYFDKSYESNHEIQTEQKDWLLRILGTLPHDRNRMVQAVYLMEEERESVAKQFKVTQNNLNKIVFRSFAELRERYQPGTFLS